VASGKIMKVDLLFSFLAKVGKRKSKPSKPVFHRTASYENNFEDSTSIYLSNPNSYCEKNSGSGENVYVLFF